MSIILALGRLRQEDNKFKVSLGYILSPKKDDYSQVLMANAYNPSYLGG
jgi:hypothetical protein